MPAHSTGEPNSGIGLFCSSPCSLPMGMLSDMPQASTSAAVRPVTSLPNTSASLPRRGCCCCGSDVLTLPLQPLLVLLSPALLGTASTAASTVAAGGDASSAATCGAASSSATLR